MLIQIYYLLQYKGYKDHLGIQLEEGIRESHYKYYFESF